jgi:hypothetical protein
VKLTSTVGDQGMVKTFAPKGKELVALGASENGGVISVYNKVNPH